jgi:predicted transcriptional regulator
MDILLEKLELIKMLADTDNPAIIKSVRKILKKEKKDWWGDLTDAQKEEIEEGERQIERGEFVLYEDMMKKHR